MKKIFVLALWLITAAFADDLTEQIRNIQVITEDYPPLNYYQDGELTGLSIEILRLVYDELGVEFPDVDVMPWARGYYLAQSDKPVMLFTMSRTPAREPLFQWVGHTHVSYVYLFTWEGSGIEAYDPLTQQTERVVAIQSDISQNAMLELGYPQDKLDIVDSPQTLFKLVLRKRASLFSLSAAPWRTMVQLADEQNITLKRLATTRETRGHYAFSPGVDEDVVALFQQALDNVREEQMQILQKYNMPY